MAFTWGRFHKEVLKISIFEMSLKSMHLKLQPRTLEATELILYMLKCSKETQIHVGILFDSLTLKWNRLFEITPRKKTIAKQSNLECQYLAWCCLGSIHHQAISRHVNVLTLLAKNILCPTYVEFICNAQDKVLHAELARSLAFLAFISYLYWHNM